MTHSFPIERDSNGVISFFEEFKYSRGSIPLIIRSKSVANTEYKINTIINELERARCHNALFSKKDKLIRGPGLNFDDEAGYNKADEEKENIFEGAPKEKIADFKNNIGHFEAFSDQSIKVCFWDRTTIRLGKNYSKVNVINKSGDIIKLDRNNALDFKR